jgi:BRCA1-associated protein
MFVDSIEFRAKNYLKHFLILDFPETSLVGETEKELIELPSCPVCLERMDPSASGVLTTQCHHSFHCNCLSKWSDSRF